MARKPQPDPTFDDETDIFSADAATGLMDQTNIDAGKTEDDDDAQPLYRVYEDSRIAVGRAVGPMWERRKKSAVTAYTWISEAWEQIFQYYNHTHNKTLVTPRGVFRRGDASENIVFSNLNLVLPAVYSKDPDISCATKEKDDEQFCQCLEALINTLFRRPDLLNAKPKVKRSVGFGLLTNFGVLKIDWTLKDDSREMAMQEMQRITKEMATVKNQEDLDLLYGQLQALEQNMEVYKPSGPSLGNVLPHNLIVDPYAEQADGLDSAWMIERIYFPTNSLTALYTKPAEGDDEKSPGSRVLVYKPTHKASFSAQTNVRDDGLGIVLEAMQSGGGQTPTSYTDDERYAFINMYYTECYLVWDKATRRVMLFQRDDWTWPIWVWDDPLQITQFFPYFIMSFAMSTGGTVGLGETSYILDQQDEVNDINRQWGRIRRTIFDYFFYNSDLVDVEEAEKFVNALRGATTTEKHMLGVKAGEHKISDMLEAMAPPSAHYEKMFDKAPIMDTINRITNTSDALRGVQFKTNTNERAVDTYQESMRLSVGAKVDVVEDVVAQVANSLAEMCIQNLSQDDVTKLIGPLLAQAWKQMSVEEFRATYNLEIVSGSMEKPNSVFKKKEAVQVAQALGQFAQAAPGAVLRIMLRALEQAFTDVVIKPEDWDALDQEIAASTQKGVSTGVSSPSGGNAQSGQAQPPNGQQLLQAVHSLPPQVKQQIVQMKQQGASSQQILAFVQQQVQQHGGGGAAPPQQQQPQQQQRQVANG